MRFRQTLVGYLFILPLILVMGGFVFLPLLNTIRLSFYEYSFIFDTSRFVGFRNYTDWLVDERTWQSWWVSIKFFIYYVPLNILLSLVIALGIDRIAANYFAGIYRSLLYFPVVLPAAIVFQMWIWLYDPSVGFFALTAQALGLDVAFNWLGNPSLALPALAMMSIWRLMGETIILLLVGLANIPKELTEASRIDGASEWQSIWKITLPLLKPTFFLILILRLRVLGLVVEPLFMTEGGPIGATMTYGLQAFFVFYRNDQVGYASAWFVLLGITSLLLALLLWKTLRPNSTT